MTLEAGKEMDRKCVLDWLKKVYITPSLSYSEYTDEEIRIFAHDALVLLKEQEAVEPINSYGTFRCGNCRNIVGYNDGNGRGYQNNFCSECGRPVKW